MKGEPRPDRRRSSRTPLNLRVRLRYERNGQQQLCHCRSFDISEGGMGLVSPYELDVGQSVELEFSLPGMKAPLKMHAVIRSRVRFRLCCEFTS